MLRMVLFGCVLLVIPLLAVGSEEQMETIREEVEKINAAVRSGELEDTRVELGEDEQIVEMVRVYRDDDAIKQMVQVQPRDEGEETLRIFCWDGDDLVYLYSLRQEITRKGDRVELVERFYFGEGELVAWTDGEGEPQQDDADHLKTRGEEILRETSDLRARVEQAEKEEE